jgi:DNA-binding IclR family transcriptional regulator
VHRLLQVLVRSGMVERGPGLTYHPGRELTRLASQLVSRFDLVGSARPLLDRLVGDWQETAVLCTYSPAERKAFIAAVAHTPHPLRFSVEEGVEISLPWGSLGRAVLAFLAPGEIEAIIRGARVGPLTGRPRPPRGELEAELAAIRQSQFSRYYDPNIEIAGIAAPVFGGEGLILGCIGVTMPSMRYHLHDADKLALAVRSAADRLSEQAAISYG